MLLTKVNGDVFPNEPDCIDIPLQQDDVIIPHP